MSGNKGFLGFSSKDTMNSYRRIVLDTPNIRGYYPFDEKSDSTDVQDIVTNMYQEGSLGTFKTGGQPLRKGSKGSLILPNDGTYLTLPTLVFNVLEWSVEFIIKTTTTGASRSTALIFTSRYYSGSQFEGLCSFIGLQLVSGGIQGCVGYFLDMSGKARGIWTNPKTINDDIPHHVVLTWGQPSGGNFDITYEKIYVDGVNCAVGTTTYSSSTALPLIGGMQRCFTNIAGNVSDFAFYEAELTAEQVLEHYNASL